MLSQSLFIQGSPWMLELLFQFYEKESQKAAGWANSVLGFGRAPLPHIQPLPEAGCSMQASPHILFSLCLHFSNPLLFLLVLISWVAPPPSLPLTDGSIMQLSEMGWTSVFKARPSSVLSPYPSLFLSSLFIHYLHAIPSQSGDQKTPTSMLNQWYSMLNRQLGMERRLELRKNLCEAEKRLMLIKGCTHTWIYWRNKFF